jgi:hypothetical protein
LQSQCVWLSQVEGWSLRAIAKYLGIAKTTVERRLGCAYQRQPAKPSPSKTSPRPTAKPRTADRLDQAAVRAEIETRRQANQSDLATAAALGISCRLVRNIAGRRAASHASECSPCPGCGRPIFRADCIGLCAQCAQRQVPAQTCLATLQAERVVPVMAALAVQTGSCSACIQCRKPIFLSPYGGRCYSCSTGRPRLLKREDLLLAPLAQPLRPQLRVAVAAEAA